MKNAINKICLSCVFLVAIFYNINSGAENLTEMAIGSRTYAMGQSSSLTFTDPMGSLNFSASLAKSTNITSAFYYSSPFEDTKNMRFGLLIPLKRHGTIGFNYLRFNVNNINWRNADGQIVGKVSYIQHEYAISYGNKISENILFGLNAKWLTDEYEGLADIMPNQKNIGVDFSMGYFPEFNIEILKGFGVGFNLKNIVQINSNYDHIPIEYRIIAENRYCKNKNNINVVFNYVKYENFLNESKTQFQVGLEYGYDFIFARIGHNDDRFTAGIGWSFRYFSFDYGYASDYDKTYYIKDQHNFTLSAYF